MISHDHDNEEERYQTYLQPEIGGKAASYRLVNVNILYAYLRKGANDLKQGSKAEDPELVLGTERNHTEERAAD